MGGYTGATAAGAGAGAASGASTGMALGGGWGALAGGVIGGVAGGISGYTGARGKEKQQRAADAAAAAQQQAIQRYQQESGMLGQAAAGEYRGASQDYSRALSEAAQRYATMNSPELLQQQYQQQALQSLQARGQMAPPQAQIGMPRGMTGAEQRLAGRQAGYANQRATNMAMPQDYSRALAMRQQDESGMQDPVTLARAQAALRMSDASNLQTIEQAMIGQRYGVAQSQYPYDMAKAQNQGQNDLLTSQLLMAGLNASTALRGFQQPQYPQVKQPPNQPVQNQLGRNMVPTSVDYQYQMQPDTPRVYHGGEVLQQYYGGPNRTSYQGP